MDDLHRLLERHHVERVVLDTTVLFARPPRTDAGRDEWRTKPRLPLLDLALGQRPVVRYIAGDDEQRAEDGMLAWIDTLTTWLDEGRSPTFFVHSPDNRDTPQLARMLHDRLRAERPDLEPLHDPLPVTVAQQESLF
jgi:uncharacterized protein YecE (DUF72 family)